MFRAFLFEMVVFVSMNKKGSILVHECILLSLQFI